MIGEAINAITAKITITASNSINVNPFVLFFIFSPPYLLIRYNHIIKLPRGQLFIDKKTLIRHYLLCNNLLIPFDNKELNSSTIKSTSFVVTIKL